MSNQHQPFCVYKGVIVAVVCLIIGLSGVACDSLDETSTPAANATSTQQNSSHQTGQTLPTSTPKPLHWTNIHTWNGNGNKTTDSFTVSDTTWKIRYTCHGFTDLSQDGMFMASVYTSDGSLADMGPSTSCKAGASGSSDETIIHTNGSFYLKIAATGDWSIAVQEKK